jgi:hypothetical protein
MPGTPTLLSLTTGAPTDNLLRRPPFAGTLVCGSAHRAHRRRKNAVGRVNIKVADLPGGTVAGGTTGNIRTIRRAVAFTFSSVDTGAAATDAAWARVVRVIWVAGDGIRRDTRLGAHPTLAGAAAALGACSAGVAVRSTRSGADATRALAATALLVLPALLPGGLALLVG